MSEQTEDIGGEKPILIVGAGVVGAACAYFLSQSGAQVTLVDKGKFGSACSHANCGYVSPSHILPLCQPGAISSTLKTLLQPNSPFSIKPRLDPALISWLWRFARKCRYEDMLVAGKARQALLNSSRSLYSELIESGELTDCEWQTLGLLFVFDSAHHFHEYAKTDKLLREEFGQAATPYDERALIELEPALKPGVGGAWHYECDAHLRPDKVMSAWRRRLEENQVQIVENCEFQELEKTNDKTTAISTASGRIECDQVIFATGAWSGLMTRQLGTTIPVQPGKGYSITMPRPAICPKYPMIFEEHRVAITPMESGYRVGSTMEFAGYDKNINERRLDLLRNGARHYLKEPLAEPVQETWYGWRPMSADGVPIIGRVPRQENVWLATGHSMLGLSMATATGKLISELLTNQPPHIDPHPYRVGRFSE